MRTAIKKWGNSAALRLPARTLARAGLRVNSAVQIEAREGKLIVSAVATPDYTLEALLARCPPSRMTLSKEDRLWLEDGAAGEEIF